MPTDQPNNQPADGAPQPRDGEMTAAVLSDGRMLPLTALSLSSPPTLAVCPKLFQNRFHIGPPPAINVRSVTGSPVLEVARPNGVTDTQISAECRCRTSSR